MSADKKASQLMGEKVIAGVTLEAKKSIVKTMVGKAWADIIVKEAALPGDHEGIFYVAVGPTKVGFFSMKRGLFRPSLNELLVEHPRSDLAAVEIKGGLMPTVHFVFRDGTYYVLACPRIHLGKLKKVRELLVQ
ncbi:MAG TPA: hypothetical protein ENG33_07085 [Chloroflexi bacterium]|nr:hypothetical protein [Chloroflexota bacterium]